MLEFLIRLFHCLKIVLMSANIADNDEVLRSDSFHFGIDCIKVHVPANSCFRILAHTIDM